MSKFKYLVAFVVFFSINSLISYLFDGVVDYRSSVAGAFGIAMVLIAMSYFKKPAK